jgi:hypothetical protein
MSGEYQNGVLVVANYLKNRAGQAITISGDAENLAFSACIKSAIIHTFISVLPRLVFGGSGGHSQGFRHCAASPSIFHKKSP